MSKQDEKWNLPQKFAPTDDLLAKNDDQQTKLAKISPFKKQSPREILFNNALIRIREIESLFAGGADQTEYLRQVLAENYALTGDYERAAQLYPNDIEAENYRNISTAIVREDQSRCRCIAPESLQSNVIPIQQIFLQKANIYAELHKCVICGRLTIKL